MIQKAKKTKWMELCDELRNDLWGMGYKIVTSKLPKTKPKLDLAFTKRIINHLFPKEPKWLLEKKETTNEIPERFSKEEIGRALKQMKNKKAPGIDGITAEMLKLFGENRMDIIEKVINGELMKNEFDDDWKIARLVLIPKPGKQIEHVGSYRPLCIISTLGKLYEKLIVERLIKETEEKKVLTEHQFGFRKGKSTITALEKIKEIAEKEIMKPKKYRNFVLMIKVDIKKCVQLGFLENNCKKIRRKWYIRIFSESY